MKIAGLDIGTTGCKCTVFDENGNYLGKAYRDYPVRRSVGGHEMDASVVMEAVFACIREMTALYPDIAGLGVTSFGEACVLTDEAGTPLRPVILYTDPRGAKECKALVDKLGSMKIARISGLRPHEMYSIPKVMWIRDHEPQIWSKTKMIFLMEDYVVYHLTGVRQIDYSLATRTMALDINQLGWSQEIFQAADIDSSLFSTPVPTGSSAGTITAEAASLTGLSPEVQIVSVAHDQIAAAVGAGAFDGGVAVDGAGTVECLTPIYDSLPDIPTMYDGYFSVVPHAVPGKYAAYAFSYTGGALIQWCVENLADGAKNEELEARYQEKHGEEPSGLLVLPHFAGAATPYMDTGSRGAILGLTTDTDISEIYRGCMEGVAYEMRLNYERLKPSGIHFTRLHATGGGAKSKVWMQMKADILNLPITALKTADAGTVGSAMLTGIVIGCFKDLEDAADHMVEKTETYLPRADMHEKYMAIYRRYAKVYDAVRPLMEGEA